MQGFHKTWLFLIFSLLFFMQGLIHAQELRNTLVLPENRDHYLSDLSIDSKGQLLLIGTFSDSVLVEGKLLRSQLKTGIYLSRWKARQLEQLQLLVSGTELKALFLETDQQGNHYLLGQFRGTVLGTDQELQHPLMTHFIAKISAEGKLLFLKKLNAKGSNVIQDFTLGDSGKSLFITGYYNDSLSYDNRHLYSNSRHANAFALKINTDGALSWLVDCPGALAAKGQSIAEAPDGRVMWAIEFRDSLISPLATHYYNVVHSDVLLVQLDATGKWIKEKRLGGVLHQRARRLRLAPDKQRFWLAGEFMGILQADSIRLITAFRQYDIYWIQFDLEGNALQGGQSQSRANASFSDMLFQEESLWLSGYFQDSLLEGEVLRRANGSYDPFCWQIALNNGQFQQAMPLSGKGASLALGLAAHARKIWLWGRFQDSIQLATSALGSSGAAAWLSCWQLPEPPPHFLAVELKPLGPRAFEIIGDFKTPFRWTIRDQKGKLVKKGQSPSFSCKALKAGRYSFELDDGRSIGLQLLILK